jgi:hypothetical protein
VSASAQPGCSSARSLGLAECPAEHVLAEGVLRTGVEHQQPLTRSAKRQRLGGGQAGDRSAADSPLEVVHRAEGGRQVDPLLGSAVLGVECGRRVVGADLDGGRADEDTALGEVFADGGPDVPHLVLELGVHNEGRYFDGVAHRARDRVPVLERQQLWWGAWPGGAVEHRAQAGVGVRVRNHEVADRPVELPGGTELVRDAQGLHPAEGLLSEVGIVENDQIGRPRHRTAVEVDPVVHHADGLSLVVVVELGATVVLRGEADRVQAQRVGFLLDPFSKLAGTGQVGHRPPA